MGGFAAQPQSQSGAKETPTAMHAIA
ncbi:MAG: hypothetical protein RIS45_588, partial [Planctomycetota bacterium]